LTEEQYHRVCQACDSILVDDDSSIERVSISWLHVIREHPEFLKNYDYLFVDKSDSGIINNISIFIMKMDYLITYQKVIIAKVVMFQNLKVIMLHFKFKCLV
jgi:hypothetical protein